MPLILVTHRQIRAQKSKRAVKYSSVINVLCDVIADVVDVNMKTRPLTSDDRVLIRALRVEKGWGRLRMMKEFPARQWKRSTLNNLIKILTKR